jgi:uncharacterized membrane protein
MSAVARARLDDRTLWWTLAALTGLGALLRLYGLEVQSLWNDELSLWNRTSVASLSTMLATRIPPDHPPGYHVLTYVWVRLAGDSPTMLRLPSALFGIATIPAMFGLGRRLYGRCEGLIGAAIATTAWMPIYYSQEARCYALLLLAVTVSSACLVDLVACLRAARPLPKQCAALYVASAAVAAYAHYSGLFFVCLQALLLAVLFVARPRAWPALAALLGLVALAYAPWVAHAGIFLAGGPSWTSPPDPVAVWRLFTFFFSRSTLLAAGVLALWAAAYGASVWRTGRWDATASGATQALAAWLIVPVAYAYVRSHLAVSIFVERIFVIVAPAVYLITAHALVVLCRRRALVAAAAVALCGTLLAYLFVAQDYYRRPAKSQFREAAAFLIAHDAPGVPLLVLGCSNSSGRYFDYYLARLGSPRRVDAGVMQADERQRAERLLATRQPPQVWLLSAESCADASLLDGLRRRFRIADEAHFYDADAWHFTR